MKLPNKITISGHEFAIKRHSEREGLGLGSMSPWDCVIKLIKDDGANESRIAETLLHEIIEAIKELHSLDLSHSVLTTLSEILFQVLRSNKLDFSAPDQSLLALQQVTEAGVEAVKKLNLFT